MVRTLAYTRSQSEYTALMFAAARGHADCARLLLDAGADKNAKNEVRRVGSVASAVGYSASVFRAVVIW